MLAGLLLLSPCKVRHSLQSLLDVPQTEVSSKSQSDLQRSLCLQTLEEAETTITNRLVQKNSPVALQAVTVFQSEILLVHTPVLSGTSPAYRSIAVPYYILFKNFKARPAVA